MSLTVEHNGRTYTIVLLDSSGAGRGYEVRDDRGARKFAVYLPYVVDDKTLAREAQRDIESIL